jgi:hypothetical protein
MALLTDDQNDAAGPRRDSARSFMAEEGAIAKQLRHWRDTGCKDGFGHGCGSSSPSLADRHPDPESAWRPRARRGRGGLVLEEIGRNLTPSPFLTTAVAAVARRSRAPRRRSAGSRASSPATRSPRWRSTRASITARAATRWKPSGQGNGFVLNGAKQFVVQGASADMIVAGADRRLAGETRA